MFASRKQQKQRLCKHFINILKISKLKEFTVNITVVRDFELIFKFCCEKVMIIKPGMPWPSKDHVKGTSDNQVSLVHF